MCSFNSGWISNALITRCELCVDIKIYMFYVFTQPGSAAAAAVIVLLLLAEQSIETPCSKYMETLVELNVFSILLQVWQ